jgi:hypothetical protein
VIRSLFLTGISYVAQRDVVEVILKLQVVLDEWILVCKGYNTGAKSVHTNC